MTWPTDTGRFSLGDLTLQSGDVLRGATLSWKTYGALSPAKDNVVVYPTSYTAQHTDQEWVIAPDKVLDPSRWFIVAPDMFGNGLSSSPSNTSGYPALVTTADNVRAQRKLLSDLFGVTRVAGVYGFSMRSPLRIAIRAVRDDESYAAARGVSAARTHFLAIVASAPLTGLAGGFFSAYSRVASTDVFGFGTLSLVLSMVLLGGAGTLYGPIVAALVLTFVSEALVSLGIWRFLIISAGMVLVLVVFPGGFAGVAQHLFMLRRRNAAPHDARKRQAV